MKNTANTTRYAWLIYRGDKKRQTAKGRIVNAIMKAGNLPMNYHQIGKSTGLTVNTITRAIVDLRDEDVIQFEVKKNKLTGYPCMHYSVKTQKEEKAQKGLFE